jgi:hypothetical protein
MPKNKLKRQKIKQVFLINYLCTMEIKKIPILSDIDHPDDETDGDSH